MLPERSSARLPTLLLLGALAAAGCGNGGPAPADSPSGSPAAAGGGEAPAATERLRSRARPAPGHAWVVFGADTVVAELARTAEEREQGLMYRESLQPGTGMLFVFEDVAQRSFWMRETFLALDIAFLDADHRIVDIQPMEPESEELVESAAPAMFALEVPRGWFAEHGVRVGDRAEIVAGG